MGEGQRPVLRGRPRGAGRARQGPGRPPRCAASAHQAGSTAGASRGVGGGLVTGQAAFLPVLGHVDEIAHPGAHIGIGERGQGQRALQGHARIFAGGQGEALGLVEEGVGVQQRGVELVAFARGQGATTVKIVTCSAERQRRLTSKSSMPSRQEDRRRGSRMPGRSSSRARAASREEKAGVHGRGSLLGIRRPGADGPACGRP